MKNNFYLITIVLIACVGGCVNSNVAWRGTVNATYQTAATDGKITNTPTHGDTTLSAEKTTDLQTDIPLTGN